MSENGRAELLSEAVARASSIRVRNVLNPLLWLSAVTFPASLPATWALRDTLALAVPVLLVGVAPPLATLAAYFYFMLRDPDRLQSEEYLITQQRLLLASKGEAGTVDAELFAVEDDRERRRWADDEE